MSEVPGNTARFVSEPRVTWREAIEGSLTLSTAAALTVVLAVAWRARRRPGRGG